MGRTGWNDRYLVGDALIDGQHRAFFDQAAAVTRALEQGGGRDVALDFYRDFLGGLVVHFQDEEALLERVGYPQRHEHATEHSMLLAEVTMVEALLATGEPHALRSAVVLLVGRLVEHLVAEDMRYKGWMARRGRVATPHDA